MLLILIEANKKRQTNGYSVQIYFGSGTDARTKAEEAKKNFEKYGNPDGPSSMKVSVALPSFVLEKKTNGESFPTK